MVSSVSLRASVIIAALLVVASFALAYVSRTLIHSSPKTADACTLNQQQDSEVYFVSCGGFF
jgi:hypothetical protein